MADKKKVLLHGPVLTKSGYGVLTRQVFRWLETREDVEVHCKPTIWGNTSWHIGEHVENGLVGRILKRCDYQPGQRFDISIQNILPNEFIQSEARYNIGMTAAVETDRCNPEWINCCNRMNLLIVPSEHTKKTLEASGNLTVRLEVVPEAFIDEIAAWSPENPQIQLDLETNFNFLMFGQITSANENADRKNTFKTLRWLCDVFRNDKDVGIIIKTNSTKGTSADRKHTKKVLKNYLEQFKKSEYPRIYLVHGDLHNGEVASLYRNPKIKALVSLTRGEGYGLPTLEAAASDVPVIATNWSGHLDFLKLGKFIEINYDLVEVDRSRIDNKIFMEGTRWAEPKEIFTKKALKKFREESVLPKEWAVDLGKKIRENFSQEQINKKYDKVFDEMINSWKF